MPPLPSLPAENASVRPAHDACGREVIADLPSLIALLPAEVDLIISALGDAMIKLFEDEVEDENACKRREEKL